MKTKMIQIYLTDNRYVTDGIRKKLKLNQSHKMPYWSRTEDGPMSTTFYNLLEFNETDFKFNHIDSPENLLYLDTLEDAHNVVYVNAFTPTIEGKQRFLQLKKSCRLRKDRIREMELDYFRPMKNHAFEELSEPENVQMLALWAEERMNKAYTETFEKFGVPLRYDICLFPLFSSLENRRKELSGRMKNARYAVFEKDGVRYYAAESSIPVLTENDVFSERAIVTDVRERHQNIPPPAEYTILELLLDCEKQGISVSNTIDMLFELYLEGIISFPITHESCISDKLLKRRMPVMELFFGEYLCAASEAEFRSYPAHLKRNYQGNGIVLLHVREFEDYLQYKVTNDKKRKILDLLIRRNLAVLQDSCREEIIEADIAWNNRQYTVISRNVLQPGWKTIIGGNEDNQVKFHIGEEVAPLGLHYYKEGEGLYSFSEIMQLVKLHCDNNSRLQLKILNALSRSIYISRIGDDILLQPSERSTLELVPENLLSLSELTTLQDQLKKTTNGILSKEEFRKWVMERIKYNTQLIEKNICKGENSHENRPGK